MRQFLAAWAETLARNEGRAAVFDPAGNVRLTFQELEECAGTFSRSLEEFSMGSPVVLQAKNDPLWPALLLACWKRSLVVLPVEAGGTIHPELASAPVIGLEPGPAARSHPRIVQKPRPSLTSGMSLGSAKAAFFKMTSGTTSDPKIIVFSEAQILADTLQVCETMGITAQDRNFGLIAFSHSYGFSNLIGPLLFRGVPLVAASDPFGLPRGLRESGASVFPGVPVYFRNLARAEESLGGTLRLCISAGAPLVLADAQAFHSRHGLKLHSFYGSSECGGICYDAGDTIAPCDGFVGAPMKGVEVAQAGREGEGFRIAVRSAAVAEGYFPDGGGDALKGGSFFPADVLVRAGEGYAVVGRVSEAIHAGGRKIHPGVIEAVAAQCPGVIDFVAFGVPNPGRGEEVRACFSGNVAPEGLRKFLAERLPAWMVPRCIVEVPLIHRDERGKVSRRELARRFGS